MTMKHNCQNSCYMKTHMWDWAIFEGCFPPRVSPSDIDGVIERNGHFLIIETKSADLDGIPRGQQITYEAFQRTGAVTILIMFGDRNAPSRAVAMLPSGEVRQYPTTDLAEMREVMTRWYQWADQKGRAA